MIDKYHYYSAALKKKREQKEYRQLRCMIDFEKQQEGSRIDFASHDFLALSKHPHVKKNTIKYVLEWGAGAAPSHLTAKHLECQRGVEETLGQLVGKEGLLLFPSTSQVHDQILSTLLNAQTKVFIDRYCHHGLIQAATRSGAQIFRYEHNDLRQLSALLEKGEKTGTQWIITESLFTIDGQVADLKKIGEIAKEHGALTYVDDSNSVGVMGKLGMGLGSHRKEVDLLFGSFGKESGSFGAYIATNAMIRDYLLSFSPSLIETTTLPSAVLGAISAALDLIPDMQIERAKIKETSHTLRERLKENRWEIGSGTSHIIPLLCRNNETCGKLSEALFEKSIAAATLSPPFVPQGATRICLNVTSLHSEDDLASLLSTLQNFSEEPSFATV